MSKSTASFALAAAALFVSGCGGSQSSEPASANQQQASGNASGNVKCMGVNECKGQGQCGVPGAHSCAGQNECRGKGWISLPEAECNAKGGTVQS